MVMATAPKRKQKRPDSCKGEIARLLQAGLFAVGLAGGGAGWAQTVDIRPSVQTRLTWTDNGSATKKKEADWIAEVTPAITASRNSGRLKGLLSAQLRNVGYANGTDSNTSFLALQGHAGIEVVENSLFVDLGGMTSRNNTSAFSGRAQGDDLNTGRNDQTSSWTVAPRLEFRLGESTSGSVGYMSRWYDAGAGNSSMKEERFSQWQGRIGDPGRGRRLGWDASYLRGETTYSQGGQDAVQGIGRGTLFINLAPQFRLRAIAGHESEDYGGSLGRDTQGIYGGGFDWTPSERTTVTAIAENRIFGTGYNLDAQHRAPRSLWRLAYSKDITSPAQHFGGGVYEDPLFQQFFNSAQLVAQLPDPVQREAYIRSLLGYPATGPAADLRTNAYFINRNLRGGVSLLGERNVLTFSFQQSERSRLSPPGGLSVEDDFALTDTIKTHSLTAALSHRLTGTSSLNSSLTEARSEGNSASGLETRRMIAMLGMTTQLGPKTVGGLSYRYQRSDAAGSESDFSENAVTANLGLRF